MDSSHMSSKTSTISALVSAAMAMTRGPFSRRASIRLLVSMFLLCSVELMHIQMANAALSPAEESALENWRQRFNLTKWTVDPCVDSATAAWVTCSTDGQTSTVISIDLKQRNLTGPIPDTTAFTNLSRLVLSENNLTGGLPPSIFNQSTLQLLYLESNQFGGSIPDMSALTSVTELALDSTQISGTIPESISRMTAATHIRLQNNPNLTGAIPDLSALSNLLYLDAGFCALNGSLPDLRNAKDLISVKLAQNDLSGTIPPALFQHEKVKYMELNDNSRLSGNVPDVTGLLEVESFQLKNCNLSGAVPHFTTNVKLKYLGLENNQFTTIPTDFTNLTDLQAMSVQNNSITGVLPDLPPSYIQTDAENQLKWITFSNNRFSGGIPKSWNELKYLEAVNADHNNLSGVIPKEMGNLTNLKHLTLSYNQFSGSIPEELGFLLKLETLSLENNQLNGTVPESLASLPNLQDLALTNNRFTAIPEVLRQKPGLNLTYDNNVQIIDGKSSSSSGLSAGAIAGVVIGAAVAIAAVLAIVLYMTRKRRKSNKDQLSKDDMPKSAHAFTLKEIKAITGNNKTLIGRGGFGPVYYGKLADGKEVAVKVRATDSKQGYSEFLNEVRLLSRLHHRNLVPLVGYCVEAQQQILVYVYMSEGSLYEHLYHSGSGAKRYQSPERQPLSWIKRLDILIDAARGIEYLHKDCNPPLIHRDVKASNILLNDKLEAKVGDLGLSKQIPEADPADGAPPTGVSTAVKGTFGYLDPEYFVRRKLTTKSDVFSFGMVILEIITCKRPQNQDFSGADDFTLAEWVQNAVSEDQLESVVDSTLKGEYNDEGMLMVAHVALKCVLPDSADRPEMGAIVTALNEALLLEGHADIPNPDSETAGSVPFSGQLVPPIILPSPPPSFVSTGQFSHPSWNTDPR